MQLYQRVDIDAGTPVAYAAVYVTRWQPEWGTPTALFREATRAELAAHPTVKARDKRIAVLEMALGEVWARRRTVDDLGNGYDVRLPAHLCDLIRAALEDDASDRPQQEEVG